MSYLDRLRAEFSEKRPPSELTKPTEGAFVSFVSIPGRHISEIEGDSDAFFEDARLDDSASEARQQRVLSMLEKTPGLRYALISDAETEGDDVNLTLGIRNLGTCELAIPKAKYDAFKVLRVIEETRQQSG